MTSPTLTPDGPVRRCFVLEDRRKHVVQPRRGANHTGIADTSERWFYTDAGLHKRILPRGNPLRTPTKPLHRQEVRAKQDPCYPNTDYINAVKTDEARRRGRTWPSQSHVLSGMCTDEDTGFAAAHTTHTPSSSCMENAKRRRRRRPHGLIGGISRSNPRE